MQNDDWTEMKGVEKNKKKEMKNGQMWLYEEKMRDRQLEKGERMD